MKCLDNFAQKMKKNVNADKFLCLKTIFGVTSHDFIKKLV